MSSFFSAAWPWLLVVGGFMVLIMAHELGHFFAAKAAGMRVEQLSLFFGPKIVRHKRGETEYCIGTIPAGGYAKITGMNPEEELPPDVAPRAYYNQPVWKRIAVIAAGPAVNIAIAFLVLFVLAFGADKAGLVVDKTEKGTPAQKLLKPDDRIVAIGGLRISPSSSNGNDLQTDADKFADIVGSHKCPGKQRDGCRAATPVRMVVLRDGKQVVVKARPFFDKKRDRNRLGFQFGTRGVAPLDPSVAGAAAYAVDDMWFVASKTVGVIGRIFEPEQRKQVSGIVGTSDVAHQTIKVGAREALILFALVSLSLGLVNLFPFLPLDGGHIFFSLVEKVRGSPVSFEVMERATVVGFVLVILLFFIGLSNDIGHISGDGFNVR